MRSACILPILSIKLPLSVVKWLRIAVICLYYWCFYFFFIVFWVAVVLWAHAWNKDGFFDWLIISEMGKLRTSNFVYTHIHGICRNKTPLKISGKVSSRGRSQGLPKIFRAPIYSGASRGHLCDSSAFLLTSLSHSRSQLLNIRLSRMYLSLLHS